MIKYNKWLIISILFSIFTLRDITKYITFKNIVYNVNTTYTKVKKAYA